MITGTRCGQQGSGSSRDENLPGGQIRVKKTLAGHSMHTHSHPQVCEHGSIKVLFGSVSAYMNLKFTVTYI